MMERRCQVDETHDGAAFVVYDNGTSAYVPAAERPAVALALIGRELLSDRLKDAFYRHRDTGYKIEAALENAIDDLFEGRVWRYDDDSDTYVLIAGNAEENY